MLNIQQEIQAGRLNAEIVTVISSLNSAGGVQRAKDAGLPVKVIRTRDHADVDPFSRRIVENWMRRRSTWSCRAAGCVCGGFRPGTRTG